MRLKSPPTKPKKIKKLRRRLDIDNKTLQDVIDWASSFNTDYKNIVFNQDWYSEDSCDIQATCEIDETEAEYQVRLRAYKQEKKAYDQWYEDNQVEIEEILTKRRMAYEEARNKQIEKLEKELKELKGVS